MTLTPTSTTYRLVETVNGEPVTDTPHSSEYSPQSHARCLEGLRARSQYWAEQGFLMLHAAGALTATGFNAVTGETLVIGFEAVTE